MSREYVIPFGGLKLGKHQFSFKVSNTFFSSFGYEDFNKAAIDITAVLEKTATILELMLSGAGYVNVDCDLSREPFDLPIASELEMVIKFGEEFNDESEEILILPHGEHEVDISQYIYEMIVLAVPQKRIHPGVADGSLKSEVLDKLREMEPKQDRKTDETYDPRWDALKKLLTDK